MSDQQTTKADSAAMSPTKALSERSPNTSSPTKASSKKDSKEVKETFKPRMSEIKATQEHTYVSPSDNILSPTSKKLSEIKGKRFANAKSKSLFARTVSKEGLKSQERFDLTGKKE